MAIETYGVAFSFCVGLVNTSSRPFFKASPTIAAGDFKVSTDGSALANLATLPDVYPVGSKSVRIQLSAGEMTGEKVVVIGSDVAGSEWDDIFICLTPEPVNRKADVAAYSSGMTPLQPTTAGRTLDVSATGEAGIDWANVGSPTTTVGLTGTTISTTQAVASVASVTALGSTAKSDVHTEITNALTTDTYAEPGSVPSATASLKDKIGWIQAISRNKVTQTATTQTLRNDGDSGTISTSTVSDDGTTFTRGKFA